MKFAIRFTLLPLAILLIAGCNRTIQKTYWYSNTAMGVEGEEQGNFQKAEIEYRLALQRAQNHLDQEEISDSLYNLGSFYRKQERLPEAIRYLSKSLSLEESLTGPSSVRTGRRMAELAAAYLMEDNLVDGLPLAKRLQRLAGKFEGSELEFINLLLKEYEGDAAKDAREVAKLTPLAEGGDREAQYQLANMYMDGKGVKQDFYKAIQLYELAADQGLVKAQHYLGVIYDKGRGTKRDDIKARKWYRLAAEAGSAASQYNYAVFLLQGRGGPQDVKAGIEWLKKSAAQGDPNARAALRSIKP